MIHDIPDCVVTQGLAGARYRVIYLRDGKERKSPWTKNLARAEKLLGKMMGLGYRSIIYVD